MMQLRNRCNQRVSWGLTCELKPHSSKVVHSMQLCMLRMSPLSLFTTGVVKILRNNITAYMCYNLEYILQFCWILCIFLQRMQKHQISPDTRGCVPLVLERSPAYMCNDSSRNILDCQNVGLWYFWQFSNQYVQCQDTNARRAQRL